MRIQLSYLVGLKLRKSLSLQACHQTTMMAFTGSIVQYGLYEHLLLFGLRLSDLAAQRTSGTAFKIDLPL